MDVVAQEDLDIKEEDEDSEILTSVMIFLNFCHAYDLVFAFF